MNTGINIGVSKEAVVEARNAIMDILIETSTRADNLAEHALDTLAHLCNVNNATVSNCQFDCNEKHEVEAE